MVVAAPAVFRALSRQNTLQHSDDCSHLRNHAFTRSRVQPVGHILLHQRIVPGLRDLALFFAGELHGDRLWRCGTAAILAAIGCDSGRFRSFALRTFYCVHLRDYERDVQSENATAIPMAVDAGASPDTVRSNRYHNTHVTIESRP